MASEFIEEMKSTQQVAKSALKMAAYDMKRFHDGYYDVVTTCIKNEKGDIRTVKSKIFRVDGTTDGQMKAQFIWPIKVDYWVIDLAPDYSWVVVGHPDHRFLFIMSRKPEMDKALHEQIVARCKAMGYPVEKLVSQGFAGAL